MNMDILKKSVQYIKSVGPQRAAILQREGIFTIRDLLYHFPSRYADRTRIKTAGDCAPGEVAVLRGTVLACQQIRSRRGLTITKAALQEGLGIFYAVWFNQPFIKKNLMPGMDILVTGKVEKGYGAVHVTVEEYEIAEGGDILGAGRLVPVYPLPGQLTQRLMRAIVKFALEEVKGQAQEFLPAGLLGKLHLPYFESALSQVHFPDHGKAAEAARKRFIFEELFLFQLALAMHRRELRSRDKLH